MVKEQKLRERRAVESPRLLSRVLNRHSFLGDVPNELARLIRLADNHDSFETAPWIERMFRRSVHTMEARRPFMALINLFDAHEPFPPDDSASKSLRSWIAYAKTVQDNYGWSAGEWTPSTSDLHEIRALYTWALKQVDKRIERIDSVLKEEGRWENTILVVTADHGQAFGEGGALFHPSAAVDSLMRVPLIVRYPGREWAGRRVTAWTSHIDIASTVLNEVGVSTKLSGDGAVLSTLIDRERETPVYAFVDGGRQTVETRYQLGLARSGDLAVLAYYGDRKFVLDLRSHVLKMSSPDERNWQPSGRGLPESNDYPKVVGLIRLLERQLGPMLGQQSDPGVVDRLRGWGYA
jgi:arylsulfatase A-like enzyme